MAGLRGGGFWRPAELHKNTDATIYGTELRNPKGHNCTSTNFCEPFLSKSRSGNDLDTEISIHNLARLAITLRHACRVVAAVNACNRL